MTVGFKPGTSNDGGRKTGKTPTKQRMNQPATNVTEISHVGTRHGYPPQELLDDLISRFLLNSPTEELQSFERILFLIEQAHWFYEDVSRDKDPSLKSFNLRDFTALIFERLPAFQPYLPMVDSIYKDFTAYKFQVPTTGAIILNQTCDKVLLVKGWRAGASWGFPKGKKNKDEEDAMCAVREVLEETGLDISSMVQRDDFLERTISQQRTRLYIVLGVPENVPCEPRTKKEISEIAWHPLDEMTSGSTALDGSVVAHSRGVSGAKYFNVYPFLKPLLDWLTVRGLRTVRPTQNVPPPGTSIVTIWKAKSTPMLAFPATPIAPPVIPTDASTSAFTTIRPPPPFPQIFTEYTHLAVPPPDLPTLVVGPTGQAALGSPSPAAITQEGEQLLALGLPVPVVTNIPIPASSTSSLNQFFRALPLGTSIQIPVAPLIQPVPTLPLLTPVVRPQDLLLPGSFNSASGSTSLRHFRFDTERILRSLEFVPP